MDRGRLGGCHAALATTGGGGMLVRLPMRYKNRIMVDR